ncbi:polar amino acid transport system ATP-binding protein [Amycolatopsis roodepoortensis]|uniref:Polar amino acid transport system ATP-binding protein n=2 Tax=Amycolatopsis roodepoortensis TaxID=700274 RepID=A0ABR9L6K3_9PSEU|nr:polar amino acid transport system ATP-binding protein [Amycolatopsis roodepoortensis]
MPPTVDSPMIRFSQVVKAYGDHVVLRDLDFTVAPGEFVSLIGPSGSGKTTILRLLMTLEKVDGGTIEVCGDYLSHMKRGEKLVPADEKYLREARKRIGMVFQQFNLFPNMNVLRNITEAPIHSLGVPRDEAEARAEELLEMVGLTEKKDEHPTRLSGGQQQRVAIARALAMRPDVLLLDEVTSALDPELVADVLRVLREIATSTDITILCVTHEMQFARDVSDRVMMFDQGQVLEDATPDKLFNDPEHDRTRRFLKAVIDRA